MDSPLGTQDDAALSPCATQVATAGSGGLVVWDLRTRAVVDRRRFEHWLVCVVYVGDAIAALDAKGRCISEIAALAEEALSERWSSRVGRAVVGEDSAVLAALLAERPNDALDLDELLRGAGGADRTSFIARVDGSVDPETAIDAALWLAVQRRVAPVVGVLLQHGADPNVTPPAVGQDGGISALALAAETGCPEVVGLLVDASADPDGSAAVSAHGWAPQPLLVARGVEVVERLLRAGAELLALGEHYFRWFLGMLSRRNVEAARLRWYLGDTCLCDVTG